ncbi:restriction endonuclease subunit S [Prevotella sp. LMAG:51]|uniref:restriction endonuclease subunit S n=2 Tax=Prevotella TaxID=838 RepID=UPI00257B0139|nr:restriction endonuclease subunit S [Prevotella sp. LMAG:51]
MCKVSDLLDFYSTNSLSWDKLEYGTTNIQNLHYGLIHVGLPTMVDIDKDNLPNIIDGNVPKNYELCKEGDVVFADASEDTNEVAKAVEYYNLNGKKVVCGLHTIHGRDNKNKTVVGYKGYAFSSMSFHHQIRRIAQGTKIYSINSKNFSECYVGIPSKEEQQKIADLLRLIDERIATQNKIIDKLQSLIKGIRNKLFENDKDWRKAKIREFLCIGNGKDYKHLDFGDIPVYGTGGKMLSVNDFLYDGDSVCIGRKGTIDTPLFLTGKFWTVDTLFYTYGFKDVLPKFCYYLFKQINWQLYNEGTGVPSLSKSTIENIKVRIPSIVQQYKICYILDSYEDKIKNEGLILDLYCSQKQYLLRQMFV